MSVVVLAYVTSDSTVQARGAALAHTGAGTVTDQQPLPGRVGFPAQHGREGWLLTGICL